MGNGHGARHGAHSPRDKGTDQHAVSAAGAKRDAYCGPFADVDLLSRDVFFVISSFLSARDLCQCALACRHFRQLLRHDPIWKHKLMTDAAGWLPYVVRVTSSTGLGEFASFRDMYATRAREARERRVTFSAVVGGNVRFEDEMRTAIHFSSYGTSKSAQAFVDGLHYCQAVIEFTSHYCGVGVIKDTTMLPDAGTGAWLSTGAVQWVTGSGLWGASTHQGACAASYATGDEVGVLLDLRGRDGEDGSAAAGGRVYWRFQGQWVGELPLAETDTSFAFCFCVGDGAARISDTSLPTVLPPGCPRP